MPRTYNTAWTFHLRHVSILAPVLIKMNLLKKDHYIPMTSMSIRKDLCFIFKDCVHKMGEHVTKYSMQAF